jgi:hypothetical protein
MTEYPALKRACVLDANSVVHRFLIVGAFWALWGLQSALIVLVVSWLTSKWIAANLYNERFAEMKENK